MPLEVSEESLLSSGLIDILSCCIEVRWGRSDAWEVLVEDFDVAAVDFGFPTAYFWRLWRDAVWKEVLRSEGFSPRPDGYKLGYDEKWVVYVDGSVR